MELSPVFARRLYLALLVENLERPNVPKLIEKTGWPRRTIQDVLKALPGIGIELIFVQDGRRHNDGYYQLSDWGPFDSQWILERESDIASSLGFRA
ncbi:helix-turn-helix domain-containing protein [Vibrio alginolyticus]